jgi:hypothetical protein
MASPLAIFFQHTLKKIVNEHSPKITLTIADNPRMHGDLFRDEVPITLPVLDDYVALEDFMMNLLQDLRIAPSDTTILDDQACSSIRHDESPQHFNGDSLSTEGTLFFDIETEDGEHIHLSTLGDTRSTSTTFKLFSALDPGGGASPRRKEKTSSIKFDDCAVLGL